MNTNENPKSSRTRSTAGGFAIVLLAATCLLPATSRGDWATPFVDINDKVGDVSEAHGWVVSMDNNIAESRSFLVIVVTDTLEYVVIRATAEKGVVAASVLGRWVIVEAQVVERGEDPQTDPAGTKLKILSIRPVDQGGSGTNSEQAPPQEGWITRYTGKTGIIADGPEGSVLVGSPADANGQATIHINDTYYPNTECRIIAIDTSGREHPAYQKSVLVPEKEYRSTDAIFPGLTLAQIKEFQFQTRRTTAINR